MAIIHRSMRGKIIDMDRLRNVNANARALGNANLNARGDKLDQKGRIISKREDIVNEYYSKKQQGIQYVSINSLDNKFADPKEKAKELAEKTKFVTPEEIKKLRRPVDTPENSQKKRKLSDEG